jgi:hypothetical protein
MTLKTFAILLTILAVLLWLLTVAFAFVAIFIDASPAEGNLGGASFLTAVISIIATIAAGLAWDEA